MVICPCGGKNLSPSGEDKKDPQKIASAVGGSYFFAVFCVFNK